MGWSLSSPQSVRAGESLRECGSGRGASIASLACLVDFRSSSMKPSLPVNVHKTIRTAMTAIYFILSALIFHQIETIRKHSRFLFRESRCLLRCVDRAFCCFDTVWFLITSMLFLGYIVVSGGDFELLSLVSCSRL